MVSAKLGQAVSRQRGGRWGGMVGVGCGWVRLQACVGGVSGRLGKGVMNVQTMNKGMGGGGVGGRRTDLRGVGLGRGAWGVRGTGWGGVGGECGAGTNGRNAARSAGKCLDAELLPPRPQTEQVYGKINCSANVVERP